MTLQIIRDWVLKFNAHGPAGLIDCKAPDPASLLNGRHRVALAEMIEDGPISAVYGVVGWRIIDLCQRVWDEFEISVSRQTLGGELRAMGEACPRFRPRSGWNGSAGYRKLSARPRHHAQAAGAIEAFKKSRHPAGGNRAGQGFRIRRDRSVVRR